MATVTPNFNWPVPTSTDLVKDGATAIEALGDSIDASLVDLKGGTTGQVLSKTSGTDMDFTWVTSDDANAIQNTIVDAKGDLIAATAADTPARLAVGTNGQVLTADSTAATGLAWSTIAGSPASYGYAAGKNKIINGDFFINQRNFASSTAAFDYIFDRFPYYYVSGTTTASVQTFTPGAAPVAGYEARNFARLAVTGQTGGTAQCVLYQNIEDVRNFAGQTITVSFWAKAGSGTPKIGVATIQSFGTGGSPSAQVITGGGSATISTSWARYSVNVTVPSISGKTIGTTANTSYLQITLVMSDAANSYGTSVGTQSATFDIWGVQAEANATATTFQTASGSIQGELALCQRYFQVIAVSQAWGTWYSTTDAALMAGLPVAMRVTPTATFSTVYTNAIVEVGVTDRTPTAYTAYKTSNQAYSFLATGSTTTATVQNGAIYIGPNHLLSAEL